MDPSPFGAQRRLWSREDTVWSVFTVHNQKAWIFLHLAHNEDLCHKKTQSSQSSLFTRKKLGSFPIWRTTKTFVTRRLSLVCLHCSHEKSLDPSPFGAQRRPLSQEDSVWSVFTVHTKKAWILPHLAHNEDLCHKKTQSGQSSLFTSKKLRSFSIWRTSKTLVTRIRSLVSLHCSLENSFDPSPFGAQRRLWSQEDLVWSVFTVHMKKTLNPSPFGAQRKLWSLEDSV